tara:strand:- start:95 stop:292 length:198 start_codon:yes stop_codon:yes gene_type:complete
METINISTLSETLKDGHPEKTHANNSIYGVSNKSMTYIDARSNQMYLVTVDLKNDDILNIQKVER